MVIDSPDIVVTAYEDSVRRQEERRLRIKALRRVAGKARRRRDARRAPLDRGPAAGGAAVIGRLGLSLDGALSTWRRSPLASTRPAVRAGDEGSAWGDRDGSPSGTCAPSATSGRSSTKLRRCSTSPASRQSSPCVVADAWTNGLRRRRRGVRRRRRATPRPIHISAAAVDDGDDGRWAAQPSLPSRTTAVGFGAIVLTGIQACDAAGVPSFVYDHGAPFSLRVSYRVNDAAVSSPQMICCVSPRRCRRRVPAVLRRGAARTRPHAEIVTMCHGCPSARGIDHLGRGHRAGLFRYSKRSSSRSIPGCSTAGFAARFRVARSRRGRPAPRSSSTQRGPCSTRRWALVTG